VLGSKSGFDSIEECYRDLSPHIFALETGLSSDPAMNWMVSRLDRYTLVSNSDLHSAGKLGREANIFSCEMHYDAVMAALKEPSKGFDGTLEFFPQEGKYHYDGHRVCGVCLDPTESRKLNGICPACGKPLTLGVMYRVLELADRPFGVKKPHALPFRSLIGLDDILAELLQCGVASKKVQNEYRRLIGLFGPELPMLLDAPLDDLARRASPRLSEAVGRVREGRVNAVSGYDGEFGTISVFP
jgi:DNA helicase-2/ATP-dependent DNA helicase PcrA